MFRVSELGTEFESEEPTAAELPEEPPAPEPQVQAALPRVKRLDTRTTIERLREFHLTDTLNSWLITLGITALAFITRIVNLGYPKELVFDETFYAKDAWTLVHLGYESTWPDNTDDVVNNAIIAGDVDLYSTDPSYVVHPPLGKWLIGAGESVFGMNPFGWRIASCVFGTLLILITIRLGRRVARSTFIGALAGLLLCFDGLEFVMSRVALLDIFQATFGTAAVLACVVDRDANREFLARHLSKNGLKDLGGEFGPYHFFRPWRIVAGLLFGCAIGVKWNSVYLLAVMGLLSVWWDYTARKLAGAEGKALRALFIDGLPAFFYMVGTAVIAFLSTWIGWFVTSGGYYRDWAIKNPDDPLAKALGDPWASWVHYQVEIYKFHTGGLNDATHAYDANPAMWPFMIRPTAMFAENDIAAGTDGCPVDAENCLRVVNGMGTPLLWWVATVALLICAIWWLGDGDWRFGLPFLATMAMYVPWFQYTDRPLFFFYAVNMIPFMCVGAAMMLGLIIGPRDGPKRLIRTVPAGAIVALIVANFTWIYPVLTGELLTRAAWLARMWFRSWI